MDNYNLPNGADNKDAPWNEKIKPRKSFDITVSITINKTFKIETSDYDIEDTYKDEDGNIQEIVSLSNECISESLEPCTETIFNYIQDDSWIVSDYETIVE